MTLHEIVARNMRSHWDYAPEPEAGNVDIKDGPDDFAVIDSDEDLPF